MFRVNKKIKEIRLNLGLNQLQFAKRIGISRTHLSTLENEKSLPSLEVLKRISNEFNIPREDLEKLWEMDKKDLERRKEYIPIRKVPVLNSISAGELLEWTDKEYPPGWAEEWIEVDSGVTDPNAFALRVHGDSMEPEFHEGEYVVVSPNTQWVSGDYVVIANSHNEKALKKIRVNKDHIVLISLNPKYEPIVLGKNENPRVIGKVVRKVKKY